MKTLSAKMRQTKFPFCSPEHRYICRVHCITCLVQRCGVDNRIEAAAIFDRHKKLLKEGKADLLFLDVKDPNNKAIYMVEDKDNTYYYACWDKTARMLLSYLSVDQVSRNMGLG